MRERYTADHLIAKRREKWETRHDIEYDKELRAAIAEELTHNRELLCEIRERPEKLIELEFVVVDKKKRTLPFFLNEVQRDFIERLNLAREDFLAGRIPEISILVLKGRQQGFTTFVTAYQLCCSILNRNFEGYTLADKSSNSETIFQSKAKFPYNQLPDTLRPTEKFNNKKMLLFEKLNSSWAVDTATENVGRSRTINFFHGSECAFWKCGISPIQAALGEAFTRDCIKIYESTANGYNDFETMWTSGAHINCFYEWWRTPEYAIPIPGEGARADFYARIDSGKDPIFEKLRWLRDDIGLTAEQLYWYFNKYEKYIDKDLLAQEYPCTPQEAFLSSGKPVFSAMAITHRISKVPKPIKVGYFDFDYDGVRITNIRWVPDRNGHIRIYSLPNSPEFTMYCIGGDTAGDGSDYFTAHVLDARTGMQVARMKHRFDADQYTRQMYCLGKYYKDALIGIEANFDTYPIKELTRLGYQNQYVREVVDEYTGKKEKRFGFRTTNLTRPPIISRLVEVVRDHCDLICDRETLLELRTIIKNEEGKAEAPAGGHDDDMMGLAIAHGIRDQVIFPEDVTEIMPHYQFGFEREQAVQRDWGEKITVI